MVILKNNSSKPQQRSHRIAPKLEFSNTQDDLIEIEDDLIEIEEVEEEVLVQREEIIFIEDESKKQDSLVAFEGGHFSIDLSEYEDGHFSTDQGSIWQTPP